MNVIDAEAIGRLGDELLEWRFKGMPPDAASATAAELAGERRDLFDGGFGPSVLTLERDAVAHNVLEMARWCAARGVSLAPHGKTTMAPQLWAEQLSRGAWGITVANVAQARIARAFGVSRVVIANQVVDPAGLQWIGAQLAADPVCRLLVWVDSVDSVALANEALASVPHVRPLEVLIEIGAPGGRGGCRTLASAVQVAEEVSRASRVRLVGVSGFEGVLSGGTVPSYLGAMVDAAAELERQGLFDPVDGEVLLSAGGSVYFDQVVETLAGLRLATPSRVVLRSGCYVTHDDGSYAASTPAARDIAGAPVLWPALRLWAHVLSRPEPGLALFGFGRRDVGEDAGLPIPLGRGREAEPLAGARLEKLNDQHAYLRVTADQPLRVGEWVGFGVSHPCTVLDRWPLVAVLDGTAVVDFIRTLF